MSSNINFLEELQAHGKSASETIEEAKNAFEKCIVEATGGASAIVKRWAKFIKRDETQLANAYEFADEKDLFDIYAEQIKEGKNHRLCYRTFVVNAYIFSLIELDAAVNDDISRGIDDMLNDIEGGES